MIYNDSPLFRILWREIASQINNIQYFDMWYVKLVKNEAENKLINLYVYTVYVR